MELGKDEISKMPSSRTYAFKRFFVTYQRVNLLLEAGLGGINEKLETYSTILEKVSNIRGMGTGETDNKENLEGSKTDKQDAISIEFTEEEAETLEKTLKIAHKKHSELDNYLYSILLVYIWGAFETYFTMLFSELFKKKPQMLISSETITYKDLIDNIKNPLDTIIVRELNKIGHFKIKEMLQYLNNKLNITFVKEDENKLTEIYLIRNIIAHNTGIIRPDLTISFSEKIKIINNEIQLSLDYLHEAVELLIKVLIYIEVEVAVKFNRSMKQARN